MFLEGESRGSVLVIESGSVKIVASSTQGEEAVLAVPRPGDVLGDLSVLTQTLGGRPSWR